MKAAEGGERKSTNSKKSRNHNEEQTEQLPPLKTCSASASGTGTNDDFPRIKVSMFDNSVENHCKAIDTISKLCGLDNGGFDDGELSRVASSVTFLREWRYFNYEPRVIRFLSETGHATGTEAHSEITLSQFSAAVVPKGIIQEEKVPHSLVSTDSRKDFILYAGGLVWALDWCPRLHQETGSDTKCEFIAVAAHPPDSTYHKLGAPLTGRGMIQVWCVINCGTKENSHASAVSTKRKYKKSVVAKMGENKPAKPRGRPRKKAIDTTVATDPESPYTQALVQVPEDTLHMAFADTDLQSITTFPNISAPSHDTNQSENNAEGKNKKSRGRLKKGTMVETPVEVPEGQFIPALNVQLPDNFKDEIRQRNPTSSKEKNKNPEALNTEAKTVNKTADISYTEVVSLQALAVEYPAGMVNNYSTGDNMGSTSVSKLGKRQRVPSKKVLENDLDCTIAALKKRTTKKSMLHKEAGDKNTGLLRADKDEDAPLVNVNESCVVKENVIPTGSELDFGGCDDRSDIFVPRVVFCLGHDGKVAWDVKWRPYGGDANKHRMGYLAVVLGNGSIEVWEVPSPQVINGIFASRLGTETDPRFVKLKPVFRCLKLNYGGRQSMPLTVEWSTSPPHDLLLAGCHDGVVALWKFSTDIPSEDVRPLLCFSADTGPIRALAWAPFEGDPESSSVILTAGHGGLKFWDLRDPFRPLWDANPSQRYIYGLDWLPDPRCVIISYDDGSLRILSLLRAANDVPVTGKLFSGTHQQGLHSYCCSSTAIWSIHVSRLTGIVAYCCADGTVLHFQLTHKAVEKDPFRNRAPHFLCGSVASDESAIAMNTELPNSPHRMKKSATEWANTPRSTRTVVSNAKNGKRARKGADKSLNPDEQTLVLCHEDEVQTRETNETEKRTEITSEANNASINTEAKADVDGPPPKIVSMYRVRWNLNKGSERWLCYGGAAGIVRCQEIVSPEIDKKLLKM